MKLIKVSINNWTLFSSLHQSKLDWKIREYMEAETQFLGRERVSWCRARARVLSEWELWIWEFNLTNITPKYISADMDRILLPKYLS